MIVPHKRSSKKFNAPFEDITWVIWKPKCELRLEIKTNEALFFKFRFLNSILHSYM